MFSQIFKISPNIPLIFLSNFQQILLKTNTFLNFCCIFSTVPQSFIDILSTFLQISQIFFKDLLRVSIKLQLKFAQIFILVYLKIFLLVSEMFLNFFWHSNYYSQKIRNSFCPDFILCFINIFKNSSLFKIYFRISQI